MFIMNPYAITVCSACSADRRFKDEWVVDQPYDRVTDIEVTEPGKVCSDCRTPLPPGSDAVEHWYTGWQRDPSWECPAWHVGIMEKEFMESGEQVGARKEEEDLTGRFILCPRCHRLAGPENDGDVLRYGLVKLPGISCTTCHTLLPLGSPATAMTFYGDPQHYQPWEHEPLQLLSGPPRRALLLRFLDSCLRLLNRLRKTPRQFTHTRNTPRRKEGGKPPRAGEHDEHGAEKCL